MNALIKHRVPFNPLAPVILDKHTPNFSSGPDPNKDHYLPRETLIVNHNGISSARLQSVLDLPLQLRPGTADLFVILSTPPRQLYLYFRQHVMYSWLLSGEGKVAIIAGISPLTFAPGFWVSLLVLVIWIGGLIGLALTIFQRQELTE